MWVVQPTACNGDNTQAEAQVGGVCRSANIMLYCDGLQASAAGVVCVCVCVCRSGFISIVISSICSLCSMLQFAVAFVITPRHKKNA